MLLEEKSISLQILDKNIQIRTRRSKWTSGSGAILSYPTPPPCVSFKDCLMEALEGKVNQICCSAPVSYDRNDNPKIVFKIFDLLSHISIRTHGADSKASFHHSGEQWLENEREKTHFVSTHGLFHNWCFVVSNCPVL